MIAKPPAQGGLPSWARTLAQRYYTRTVNTFLLHGAVRDLQPVTNGAGQGSFDQLRAFFSEELFAQRDHVLFYDRSSGIRAARPETQADLSRMLSGYDAVHGTELAKSWPRDPGRALGALESYLRLRASEGKSLALVLDFAETLVPAGDLSHLSPEDRFVLVTLLRWAQDPQLLTRDVSIVLVAENLAELSPRLTRNPYVAAVEIPLPDEQERLGFIEWKRAGKSEALFSELAPRLLARTSAGLSRLQLDRLLTEVIDAGTPLTLSLVKERKKDILQAECHGLLEFIEPSHSLDSVAGHKKAKEMLQTASRALKRGHSDVLPMGYLIAGPVGTGKTFLTTCFAGDMGIPCVKFLNFRSQWQGVTEANLERIFTLLKALWPVAVIIDEADAFLGQRDSGGDSGTSSRVFASLAAFMGNTEYRGKILWFLLTCRPDLLPVDLKRQGRAEEHLALFHPQSPEELDELFAVLAKKTRVALSPTAKLSERLSPARPSPSGADIEAILVRAKRLALSQDREQVTDVDLNAVLGDFVSPAYPLEIELQNLVAVQECTSRELLPPGFRDLAPEDVNQRIGELKRMLDAP